MPDEQPAAVPVPATVGAMDPRSAGMLEIARGAGTTGLGVVAIWYILSGDIRAVSDHVSDVADEVGAVRTQVEGLRVDVVRLQVQVAGLQAQPVPPR